MKELTQPSLSQEERPPRDDVDDLIFRGDQQLVVSDR